jgi:hypothetical protein
MKKIIAGKYMSYIQLSWKRQQDDEKNLKFFREGKLILWLSKDPQIRKISFNFPRMDHSK